jgi:hypothetical protein
MIVFSQGVSEFLATNIPDVIDIEGVPTTILEWQNFTEYTIGDIVRDGSWYFRTASDIEATEDRDRPSEDRTAWARYSPSNAYAMIDDRAGTSTEVDQSPTTDYITTGATQTVTTAIDEIVLYEVASGSTGTGELGHYYKAKTVQSSIDLDTQLFDTDTTNWEDLGILGKIIAEFDNSLRYDAVVFGEVQGSSITVELINSSEVVEQTITQEILEIGDELTSDMYSYYYSPLGSADSRYDLFFKLPSAGVKIRVTIEESIFGGASCSYMIAGNSIYAGEQRADVNFSYTDNSIQSRDSFGIVSLTQRYATQNLSPSTYIKTDLLIGMKKKMRSLFGIPVATVVDDREESTYQNIIQLSVMTDFTPVLRTSDTESLCSFKFEELI